MRKYVAAVFTVIVIGALPALADNLITNGTGIIGRVRLANGETVANGTDGTITLGRNESGTLTVTAVDDNSVCALTINSGGAAAMSIDTGGAAAVNVGNTNATSVSVCNSAACDTVSIGTNTDADTISIGDSTDTTSATSALWSITGPGVATMATYRVTNAATLTAANPTPTKANMQAAGFWGVDTTSNAVDVDLPAMDAADVGSDKTFAVLTGGTNALTVTSGTLTVSTRNALTGTSCEDAGDFITCKILSTTTATCVGYCND